MYIIKDPEGLTLTPVGTVDLEGLRRVLRTGDPVRIDVYREPTIPDRELRTKVDKEKRTVRLTLLSTVFDGQRLVLKGRIAQGHQTASLRPGESIRLCFRDQLREGFLDQFADSDLVYQVLALDASTAYCMKVGQGVVIIAQHELDWSQDTVDKTIDALGTFRPKLITGIRIIGVPLAARLNAKYLPDSEALVPPFIPRSKSIRRLLEGTGDQRDRALSEALTKARDQGRLRPLALLDEYLPRVKRVYLFESPLDSLDASLLAKTVLIDPRYEGFRPSGDVLELYAR